MLYVITLFYTTLLYSSLLYSTRLYSTLLHTMLGLRNCAIERLSDRQASGAEVASAFGHRHRPVGPGGVKGQCCRGLNDCQYSDPISSEGILRASMITNILVPYHLRRLLSYSLSILEFMWVSYQQKIRFGS